MRSPARLMRLPECQRAVRSNPIAESRTVLVAVRSRNGTACADNADPEKPIASTEMG
jgi:hypothetical protein